MKQSSLKLATIILFGVLGLTGCLSSNSNAESTEQAKATSTAPTFIEGKHYVDIFPEMNTDAEKGKIEVIELFWLGCPHCYALEPTIKEFIKNKPDDVEFKQVPAVLNPQWAFHAKAFYAAKALDPTNQHHLIDKLFDEIHKKHNRLNTPEKLEKFFTEQGYSKAKFNNALHSMAVSAAMSHANTISTESQATAVPTLIINGKYRTSAYMAGGEENLIKVMNMLIEKERKQ